MQKSGSGTLENSREEDLGLYGLVIDIIRTWGDHLEEQGSQENGASPFFVEKTTDLNRLELFLFYFYILLRQGLALSLNSSFSCSHLPA